MMTLYVFDLDAGRTCLDFANTLGASSGEHLNSYADLVAFAEQSAYITPEDAAWLRAQAERDRPAGDAVLRRAYRLRAAIYAIFSAVAACQTPAEGDLETLNGELGIALQHTRVDIRGGYRWDWDGCELSTPLWAIARSAADVLTSEAERGRVRECSSDTCRWLFLDTSKNRSRQWCSMQSCGNREKARRHYQKVRAKQSVD
jgi:predicted RNA-binding Zn ribbon-like protein